MNINKQLYKIMRGHFRLCVDGLSLFFTEPTSDLIAQSYDIYEEAYDAAYGEHSCVDSELNSILVENDIWNPSFEKDLSRSQDELDNLKVEAFESYLDAKALKNKKRQIFHKEGQIEEMLQKKHKIDYMSCDSVAENARWTWLISQCVTYDTSKGFLDSHKLLELYKENVISNRDIRKISRVDLWRQIWSASKKVGSLFNRSAMDLSNEQLILISYSSMYDSVYEHPEAPTDSIIDDDYCLDGWLILQKRKNDKNKKAAEVDQVIKNPKIKNAKEVFIVTNSQEDANKIFDMNDSKTKQTLQERAKFIQDKGTVTENDLPDVRQQIQIAQNNSMREAIKKGK